MSNMWPFLSRPPSFLSGQNGDRRESSTSTNNNGSGAQANKEPEEVDYFYLDGFFSENPPDKFACPICLCPVQREAYLTECCGRHFCRECITRLVGSKPCPMCKSSPLAIFPNKERQREINALAVCCPVSLVDSKDENGEDGQISQEEAAKDSAGEGCQENSTSEGETGTKCLVCDWKGELGQLEAHLKGKHADDRRWRVAEKAPAERRNRVSLTRTRSMEEFMEDWSNLFVPRLRPRIRRLERNLGGPLRVISRNNPWSQESGWDSDDSDSSDDGEPVGNSLLSPSGRVIHPYFTVPDTSYSVLHPVEGPGGLSPALPHPYHQRDLAAATQVESRLESSLGQLNLATEYSSAPNLSNESNSSDGPGAVGETLSEGRGVVGTSGPHPTGRGSNESSSSSGNRFPQVGGRLSERDGNNHSYVGARLLSAYRPPTPHSNVSEFPQSEPLNRMSRPHHRHHFVHHSFGPFHSPPRPPSVRPRPPSPPHHHRHPCPHHQHHHGREFNHIPPPAVFQENRRSQIPPRAPSPEFFSPPILPPPVSPPNPHHRWRTISPTDFEPYGSRQAESSRSSAFVNSFQPPQHGQNCPLRSHMSQQHQRLSHPLQQSPHSLQRAPRPLQRPTRPLQRPSHPPNPHPLLPPTPPMDGEWYVTHAMSPGSAHSMMVWPDPPRPVSPPPWHNPLRPPSPPSPHPSWFVHSPAPSPSPHGLQQAVLHALNSSQTSPYSEENVHSLSVADNGLAGSQEVPWGNQDSRHINSSSTRPDTPFHDGY